MNPSSCYEDTKKKGGHNKLKGGQPLIKDKRQLRDVSKEKSIEKPLKTTHEYHSTKPNVDYHKQRVLQDLPPHEPDPVRTFTAQLSHLNVLHFGQPLHVPPSANPDKLATSGVLHFQQTNRNLTFGNVRQVKNPKEIGHTQPVPHQDPRKPLQMRNQVMERGSELGQHEKSVSSATNAPGLFAGGTLHNASASSVLTVERVNTEKILQRIGLDKNKAEKKDRAKIISIQNKVTVDDFSCNEELQFKPVEKKCLIPEKKVVCERTTSKFDVGKAKKSDRKSDEKQIRDFEEFIEKAQSQKAEAEAMAFINMKQEQYSVDPQYLSKQQKNITWLVRAILVDWIRQVSYEFALQRETYHIAVVLLDNFLARTSNIARSSLQAIGATTMFIASKLQEFECKFSREFVMATNNCCTVEDIYELEIKITMEVLKFKINPPTLYNLANSIMAQWDAFVEVQLATSSHPFLSNFPAVRFKNIEPTSYSNFRQLMQLLDCSILDVQTLQYKPKTLVCSFMYLVLGKQFGEFTEQAIVEEFPRSSRYLTSHTSEFNYLYDSFVNYCFGMLLVDLLPTVQYAATYFILPLSFEPPQLRQSGEQLETMPMEKYCSYQTYNNAMLRTVRSRYRGIYE